MGRVTRKPKGNPPRWYLELLERCPPTRHTVPDWTCDDTLVRYHQFCVIADWLRITPMPHQRLAWAILAMPSTYELVSMVGRQCGKTVGLLPVISHTLLHKARHAVVYSAQTGTDAQNKIKHEFYPLLRDAGLTEENGVRFKQGAMDFGLFLPNETRLKALSSDREAGRGETRVALAIIDEARSDRDQNRWALLVPMQQAADDPKLIVASTAGDMLSVGFNDKQDKARHEYDKKGARTALLEWTIDGIDDYDINDEALWWSVLPAVGYSITKDSIRRSKSGLEDYQFETEYLCKRLSTAAAALFPVSQWSAVCRDNLTVEGELVLGIDAPPDENRVAGVVADKHGRCEMVPEKPQHQEVWDWLSERLDQNLDITRVVMAKGTTIHRAGELAMEAGFQVSWVDTTGMRNAASRFDEAVKAEPPTVALRTHPRLTEANAGAFRRPLTGGFVFGRQEAREFISPLIAASLAFDYVRRAQEREVEEVGDIWDQKPSDLWGDNTDDTGAGVT